VAGFNTIWFVRARGNRRDSDVLREPSVVAGLYVCSVLPFTMTAREAKREAGSHHQAQCHVTAAVLFSVKLRWSAV